MSLLERFRRSTVSIKGIFIFTLLGTSALPLILAALTAIVLVKKNNDKIISRQIEEMSASCLTLLENQRDRASIYGSIFSGSSKLVNVIERREAIVDIEKTRSYILNLIFSDKNNSGASEIIVTNDGGISLAMAHNPSAGKEDLSRHSLIGKALQTKDVASGVVKEGDAVFIGAAYPIMNDYMGISGIYYISYALDEKLFDQLKVLTNGELMLFTNGQAHVSTFKALTAGGGADVRLTAVPYPSELEVSSSSTSTVGGLKKHETLRIGGKEYECALLPITDAGGAITANVLIAAPLETFTQLYSTAEYTMLIYLLLAVTASLLVGYFISKRLTGSLHGVLDGMKSIIAEGDLTKKVNATSFRELQDVARWINEFVDAVGKTIRNVKQSFTKVDGIADEVATAARKVADGSKHQSTSINGASDSIATMNQIMGRVVSDIKDLSTSLESTSSSIVEMSASISQVAGNARQLNALVDKTSGSIERIAVSIGQVASNATSMTNQVMESSSAMTEMDVSVKEVEKSAADAFALSEKVSSYVSREGKDTVAFAATGFTNIRNSISDAARIINELSKNTENITAILDIISDVAEQTNLLALNASILAAQAGQHGKGFSVVAKEVKALSMRTAASIQEISGKVKDIQSNTKKAVQAIGEGLRFSDDGVVLINNVGKALDKLGMDAEAASGATQIIARATNEQSTGIKALNLSIEHIAVMAREISSATNEQAQSSDTIVSAVAEMRGMAEMVQNASMEQAEGAKLISSASERGNSMSQQVLQASKEEARNSELIVTAAAQVSDIARANLEVVGQFDQMVQTLTDQAALLREEIARFKVDED